MASSSSHYASSSSSSFPSFESHGGRLEEFDDGHRPETFRHQQKNEQRGSGSSEASSDDDENDARFHATPRIVRYNGPARRASSSSLPSSSVHVYDNVLDPNVARMLYDVTAPPPPPPSAGRQCAGTTSHIDGEAKEAATVDSESKSKSKGGESPWGTYVTMEEAREWTEWKKGQRHEEGESSSCDRPGDPDRADRRSEAWRRNAIRFLRWRRKRRGGGASSSLDEKKEERTDAAAAADDDDDYRFDDELVDADAVRHSLAVEAVAEFLLSAVPHRAGTVVTMATTPTTMTATAETPVLSSNTSSDDTTTLFSLADILEEAHGVAVWALSSGPGQSVSYHVDYAELLRYEHDVTVPPLWAGTVQCSELWNEYGEDGSLPPSEGGPADDAGRRLRHRMEGGEFCVNLRGLDHYAEHGYKGNLSGDPAGGWRRPSSQNEPPRRLRGGLVHVDEDRWWATIPYAFNRGIVHRGELPHLSAPVESISEDDHSGVAVQDGDDERVVPLQTAMTRVIVGFNVFGHDVGPRVAEAPEHSRAFRRRVRMHRSIANAAAREGEAIGGGGDVSVDGRPLCRAGGGMDLARIRKNRGLTKLLVLAKREKVKEELRRDQERLTRDIWGRVLRRLAEGGPMPQAADLVEELGGPNDNGRGDGDGRRRCWPKSVDVHVHLHHMLLGPSTADSSGSQRAAERRRRDGGNGGETRDSHLFRDEDGAAGGPPGTWYRLGIAGDDVDGGGGGLVSLSTRLELVQCER